MGFFSRLRGKSKAQDSEKPGGIHPQESAKLPSEPKLNEIEEVNFYRPITSEEKELVSVISTSIAAGDNPNSKFRIVDIQAVDTDKEIAAAIVAAFAANNNPNSHFVLKSIEEVVK